MFCSTRKKRKRQTKIYLFILSLIRIGIIPFAFAFDIVFLNLFSQQVYVISTLFYLTLLVFYFNRNKYSQIVTQLLFPLTFGLNLIGNLLLAYVVFRNEGILNPEAIRRRVFSTSILLLSVFWFHVIPPTNDIAIAFIFGHQIFCPKKLFQDRNNIGYWCWFFISPAVYIFMYAIFFDVGFIYGFNLTTTDYMWLSPSVFLLSLFSGAILFIICSYSAGFTNK